MQFNRDQVNAASAEGRRSKLDKDGSYVVKIDRITTAKSFENAGAESYVIELEVLESDNPQVKVGQERSITINRLDSKVDYELALALGNLKSFLASALADEENRYIDVEGQLDGDPDGWVKMIDMSFQSDGAAFVGLKLRINVERIHTKKSKKAMERGDKHEQLMFAKPTFKPFDLSLIPA
jgi:hypothetical protein